MRYTLFRRKARATCSLPVSRTVDSVLSFEVPLNCCTVDQYQLSSWTLNGPGILFIMLFLVGTKWLSRRPWTCSTPSCYTRDAWFRDASSLKFVPAFA